MAKFEAKAAQWRPLFPRPFFKGNILVLSQKTSSAKSRAAVLTEHTKPKIKNKTLAGNFALKLD